MHTYETLFITPPNPDRGRRASHRRDHGLGRHRRAAARSIANDRMGRRRLAYPIQQVRGRRLHPVPLRLRRRTCRRNWNGEFRLSDKVLRYSDGPSRRGLGRRGQGRSRARGQAQGPRRGRACRRRPPRRKPRPRRPSRPPRRGRGEPVRKGPRPPEASAEDAADGEPRTRPKPTAEETGGDEPTRPPTDESDS